MDGYDFRRNSPYMSPHTYSCLPPIGRCLSASGSPYQKMQRGLPTRSPSWPYLQGRGALGPGEASPPFHAPLESYRPYTAPAPLLTPPPPPPPSPPPPPLPPPMPTASELPLRRLFDSQLNLRYGSLHGIHGSRLVGTHSLMGDCYDSSLEYDLFEGESFPSPFDVPYRPPTRSPFEPPEEEPYVTTMCPSSHSTFDCPSRSFDVLPREPSVRKPAWADCFPSSWRCESQADWPWYPRAEWTNYPPITTQDIRMGIRPGQSHLKRYSESGPTTTRPGVARCYSGCQMRQVPEIWSRDTLATEAPAKKPRKQWNALRPPLENPQLKSPNQLVTPDHMIDRRSSFWPPGELFAHLKQLNTQRSQLGSLDRIQEVPGDRLDEDPQGRGQGGTQSESPGSWFPSDESMDGLSDRQRIHPKSLQDRLLDIAESEISLDPKDARENSSTEDVQRKTRCELSQEPQKKSSDRSTDVRPNTSHGEPPNRAQGETHYGPENQSPSEVGGGSRSEPRLGGPKSVREDAPLEKPAARSLSYIVQPSGGGFCGASPPSERRGPQGSRIVRGARMQHRFLPNWLFLALERAPEVLHAAVDFYFEHMRWPELADQPTHFRESIPASARPGDLRATAGGFAPAWVFALRRLAEGGVVAGALLAQALAHFFARGAFPPLAFYPPALRTACAHLRLQDDHFYALDL